jgi:hypothetical protein
MSDPVRVEAEEWLRGKGSMTNLIPQDPINTWIIRIAQADAAMTEKSYWILRAYNENLIERKEL